MESIIYNQIFTSFKTGDIFIDSILILLFTKCIEYVVKNRQNIFDPSKFTLFKFRKRNRIYIDRFDLKLHLNETNETYKYLSWYLSTINLNQGNLRAHKLLGSGLATITLASDSSHELIFNNKIIKILYFQNIEKNENSMVTTKDQYVLEHIGYECSVIKDFLDSITQQYADYYFKQTWTQKINFLCHDDKHGLYWSPHPTGNNKTFKSILMDETKKTFLQKDVETFLKSKNEYEKIGISWSRGYLFYGKPGCGKTSLIRAISNEVNMHIYVLDLSAIKTDQDLRKIFRTIPTRSVVVMEDIDCFDVVQKRGYSEKSQYFEEESDDDDDNEIKKNKIKKQKMTLGALLNELDGITSRHGQITIMTTNRKEILDPALIRPGRIDFTMELCKATREEISQAFLLYKDKKVDSKNLPTELEGKYTVAEICNMIQNNEEIK